MRRKCTVSEGYIFSKKTGCAVRRDILQYQDVTSEIRREIACSKRRKLCSVRRKCTV